MTLDEQLAILQAAKRGDKIERNVNSNYGQDTFWKEITDPSYYRFDFFNEKYRIVDPYAKLKAAAKDPTKEIFVKPENMGFTCPAKCDWIYPPDQYEIRDMPKKKVVKYLCWEDIEHKYLMWFNESAKNETCGMIRRPAFDKECEVEDE